MKKFLSVINSKRAALKLLLSVVTFKLQGPDGMPAERCKLLD